MSASILALIFALAGLDVQSAIQAVPVATDEWVEPCYEQAYYEPDYYEPTYYTPTYYAPSDGLTAEGGVNYHDGRMETYYSSNVLVHQDISDWTADDEGFYRTDEGYYVVAASDMEQGTVFEGSKGECVVLDSGCADGVTDYYVTWLAGDGDD